MEKVFQHCKKKILSKIKCKLDSCIISIFLFPTTTYQSLQENLDVIAKVIKLVNNNSSKVAFPMQENARELKIMESDIPK